ncbi:hypothetical protein ACXZ9C_11070 [Streptococcus agalactiae]
MRSRWWRRVASWWRCAWRGVALVCVARCVACRRRVALALRRRRSSS